MIFACGFGIKRHKNEKTLDVLYPAIQTINLENILTQFNIKDETGFYPFSITELLNKSSSLNQAQQALIQSIDTHSKKAPYANIEYGLFILKNPNQAITTTEEAYFKLQLLSQRKVKPHALNLEQLFGSLQNIAWSNKGPILIEDIEQERLKYHTTQNPLSITHVDKFPYLVNYHIPSGVRIASGSQVRLGAYLGEGTTIMPAGYVNFNAGTMGTAMVEGRISAGVVVDTDTDIGGGASIMGTLSGGNNHVISIGAKCLLGANSGTGISLGFGCTIQAGLYLTAGMKISLYNENNTPIDIHNKEVAEGKNRVKASELSGKNHLLFLQDSQSGKVVCRTNTKTIELNHSLHKNTNHD